MIHVRDRGRVANPEIEVKQFGMIFLDDFCVPGKPVGREFGAHIGPIFQEVVFVRIQGELQVRRSIERRELGIVKIRFNVAAGVQEPVMLDSMRGRSKV